MSIEKIVMDRFGMTLLEYEAKLRADEERTRLSRQRYSIDDTEFMLIATKLREYMETHGLTIEAFSSKHYFEARAITAICRRKSYPSENVKRRLKKILGL